MGNVFFFFTSDTSRHSLHRHILSWDCHRQVCYIQDRSRSDFPTHLESLIKTENRAQRSRQNANIADHETTLQIHGSFTGPVSALHTMNVPRKYWRSRWRRCGPGSWWRRQEAAWREGGAVTTPEAEQVEAGGREEEETERRLERASGVAGASEDDSQDPIWQRESWVRGSWAPSSEPPCW